MGSTTGGEGTDSGAGGSGSGAGSGVGVCAAAPLAHTANADAATPISLLTFTAVLGQQDTLLVSVCWVRGRSGLLEQRAQVRADEIREERRYLEDPPVTTSMGPMIHCATTRSGRAPLLMWPPPFRVEHPALVAEAESEDLASLSGGHTGSSKRPAGAGNTLYILLSLSE